MAAVPLSPQSNTPNLKGWVNTFYRHYKGQRLGPYYVRRWKVGRKIYREYIKPQDVERVKAACRAHREGKKRISKVWLQCANLDYMLKMVKWQDQGKLRPVDLAYMNRIKTEGWQITGHPHTRRRVTRELKEVYGKTYVLKTIHEVDGTTKTFMVPFSFNDVLRRFLEPKKAAIERLVDGMMATFFEINGPNT